MLLESTSNKIVVDFCAKLHFDSLCLKGVNKNHEFQAEIQTMVMWAGALDAAYLKNSLLFRPI